MNVVASESRVIVETSARGLLAAAAHDLRIEAPVASGESADVTCTARFAVASMKVAQSCRHGTGAWQAPNERDARDVEQRIRTEAFESVRDVTVEATLLDDARAKITVRAARAQTVEVPVKVEREGDKTTVRGRCDLSLQALGTGKIHVPLGAIKLDDRVSVTFDVVLHA